MGGERWGIEEEKVMTEGNVIGFSSFFFLFFLVPLFLCIYERVIRIFFFFCFLIFLYLIQNSKKSNENETSDLIRSFCFLFKIPPNLEDSKY